MNTHAWILSGGGAKGAWQAGVMHYLSRHSEDPKIITGTSVGALNGAMFSMFPCGAATGAADALTQLWLSLRGNKDIYRAWPLRWLQVPWKHSLYDATPLHRLIERIWDRNRARAAGRIYRVAAVSIETQQLLYFDPTATVHGWRAILASSAYPVAFQPVQVGGSYYTDGGVREVVPLRHAIHLGADHLTVIGATNPTRWSRWSLDQAPWPKLVELTKRIIDIVLHEGLANDLLLADIQHCRQINQLVELEQAPVHKRHVTIRSIFPNQPLGSSLDFAPKRMAKLWQQGVDDARAAMGG